MWFLSKYFMHSLLKHKLKTQSAYKSHFIFKTFSPLPWVSCSSCLACSSSLCPLNECFAAQLHLGSSIGLLMGREVGEREALFTFIL